MALDKNSGDNGSGGPPACAGWHLEEPLLERYLAQSASGCGKHGHVGVRVTMVPDLGGVESESREVESPPATMQKEWGRKVLYWFHE